MKKILIAAIAMSFLVACSKNKGGKELAQEVCDCSKKANALPATDPSRSKAQADCSVKQGEAWNKIKDKAEEADAFNTVLGKCASQLIEDSFGK